jgi:hypothetical protein
MWQKNPHLKGESPTINVGYIERPEIGVVATTLIDYE